MSSPNQLWKEKRASDESRSRASGSRTFVEPRSRASLRDSAPHEERVKLAARLQQQHPDRVPVCVECRPGLRVHMDRYLAPGDVMLGHFMSEVRKHAYVVTPSADPLNIASDVLTPITPEQGMYLMVSSKGIMPCVSNRMRDIHAAHKEDDGILYLTLCIESTFGGQ